MLFHTQRFLLFFLVVFALYWAMPWKRPRVWLLVAASFYFYISWNARLAALIGASAVIDYVLGLLIVKSGPLWKKRLLGLSILWNIGQLIYFKYTNFFLNSFADMLSGLGLHPHLPTLSVILPIGISFYTFEAISYTVDVYQGRIDAERNLLNFVLFITFFPRLIAGPIIRARYFLPQVQRRKGWDWARLELGANYFLLGLIKKLVIADRLALFVDPFYQNPERYSSGAAWIAVFAYVIQIYGDFSGYSDMAIGLGHFFDYRLPKNFRMPYLAPNITELWRRWHISLTSWLRDYVFIPLNRGVRSRPRIALNVVITMTLCGLWHGAKWTFVIFGMAHGCWLVLHHMFGNFCRRRGSLRAFLLTGPGTVLRVALTFGVFALTGVLFRSTDFQIAGVVFSRLFDLVDGKGASQSVVIFWSLMALVLSAHLLVRFGIWQQIRRRSPDYMYGIGFGLAYCLMLVFAPDPGKAFIYFQF